MLFTTCEVQPWQYLNVVLNTCNGKEESQVSMVGIRSFGLLSKNNSIFFPVFTSNFCPQFLVSG